MNYEQLQATRAVEARKAKKSSIERKEREARIDRIEKNRQTISRVLMNDFDRISKFRAEVVNLKNTADAMSKKYIMEQEEAGRLERAVAFAEKRH